jgi:hypothetical protein
MNPHLFELLHQDPDVTKHFNCEKKYILTFVNKYFSPKEKLAFDTDCRAPPPPRPPRNKKRIRTNLESLNILQ